VHHLVNSKKDKSEYKIQIRIAGEEIVMYSIAYCPRARYNRSSAPTHRLPSALGLMVCASKRFQGTMISCLVHCCFALRSPRTPPTLSLHQSLAVHTFDLSPAMLSAIVIAVSVNCTHTNDATLYYCPGIIHTRLVEESNINCSKCPALHEVRRPFLLLRTSSRRFDPSRRDRRSSSPYFRHGR
jgi:hypothetical protein